jgi:protein involved in polysaccharide export with SLBB domain
LAHPGEAQDLIVLPADYIDIPPNPGIVRVTGAVNHPLVLPYEKGKTLDHYIALCGGYLASADKTKVAVTLSNSMAVDAGRKSLFRSAPEIIAGSTIEVPFKGHLTSLETVEVRGSIVRPGARLGYYLHLCGGLTQDADPDQIVIHLPDGGLIVKKDEEEFNPVLLSGSIVVVTAKTNTDSK